MLGVMVVIAVLVLLLLLVMVVVVVVIVVAKVDEDRNRAVNSLQSIPHPFIGQGTTASSFPRARLKVCSLSRLGILLLSLSGERMK